MSYPVLFAVVVLVLLHGHLLGSRLIRGVHWIFSLVPGIALFFGLQSLIQTVWYYADGKLGKTSDLVSLAIAIALTHLLTWQDRHPIEHDETVMQEKTSKRRLILGIGLAFLALISTSWIINAAFKAGTVESIRTPWPLLPSSTLWMVAFGWTALIASIWFVRSRILATLHSMLLLASTLSIAALIYRIGYGFDGFLHIASEKILLTTGTLSPKPLYYIGEYVLTTWLARLSHLPIADIDRWFLPVVATVLLPLTFYCSTARHKSASFLTLALIPLGAFIATTPQGVAYLFGLIALLFASSFSQPGTRNSALVPLIFALWSVAAHPLAGIPLLCITIALILLHSFEIGNWKLKLSSLSPVFALLAAISVPVMFVVISLKGGTTIAWDPHSLLATKPWIDLLGNFAPYIGNHFVLWPAWSTLVEAMLPLLLIALAIVAIVRERREKGHTAFILLLSAVGLWIAATVLKTTGDFTFLIDYERGNYANRLDTLAVLCLLPAILPAFEVIRSKLSLSPKLLTGATVIALLATATALTYDALPRNDALVAGHGWSTSRADLDAVQLIDRDAGERPYTVLADQSVSAAAVASLGFKRYAGDVFFYPIPTGGPLYDTYLKMTYNEPSRDTARDAASLGKTDLVYVVLNEYWWKASTVSENLRAIANKDWTIANGKVWVYKFELNTASSASTTGSN
ncbi:MAG: hypothetical protein ABIO72_04555 [Patescibacteria group bacterium]